VMNECEREGDTIRDKVQTGGGPEGGGGQDRKEVTLIVRWVVD
jgi:hypothetical protein